MPPRALHSVPQPHQSPLPNNLNLHRPGCEMGTLELPIGQSLHFMAHTETWIILENTATPATLSTKFSFSHTPRPSGRGGGTGLLISPKWSYMVLSLEHLTRSALELHAVSVKLPTSKHNIVVIYRTPGTSRRLEDQDDCTLSLTMADVRRALKRINPRKSPGPDDIPVHLHLLQTDHHCPRTEGTFHHLPK